MSSHPIRKIRPTAKLTTDNAGELILTLHRRAVVSAGLAAPSPPSSPVSERLPSRAPTDTDAASSPGPPPHTSTKRPQAHVSGNMLVVDNGTDIADVQDDAPKSKKPKATAATAATPGQTATLQHETLIIEIDDLDDPLTERLNKSSPTADIKTFFTPLPLVLGQNKMRMQCKLCE